MESNNIEQFNVVVGLVFARCYLSFPIRETIYFSELGDELDKIKGSDEEGFLDLGSESNKFAEQSVKWLSESGYLYGYVERTDTQKTTITLSPKTLEVMNKELISLKENDVSPTIGETLVTNVKKQSKELILFATKEALKSGVKMFIGS